MPRRPELYQRVCCCVNRQAVLECPHIVEVAVIGVPDELKGNVPLGLCVVRAGEWDVSIDKLKI